MDCLLSLEPFYPLQKVVSVSGSRIVQVDTSVVAGLPISSINIRPSSVTPSSGTIEFEVTKIEACVEGNG